VEIDQLGLLKWENRRLTVDVPEDYGQREMREFQDYSKRMDLKAPGSISFEVRPTLKTPYGDALRVQDYMVLRIMNANKWRKPLYFAVTVARNNMLSELQDYMRMDGLALKVVPYKNWEISPEEMERNLVDVFKYRSLQDPQVYYDNNITGLLQNYRTGFLQLAEYHIQANDLEKVKYLLNMMEVKIPSNIIPWTNQYLKMIRDSYRFIAEKLPVDSLLSQNYTEQDLMIIGQNLFRINNFSAAEQIFEMIYQSNPANVHALSLLVLTLERTENYQKGITVLEDWLKRTPNDTQAREKLNTFKSKLKS
jgi:tetratricopeptide (TPR) repeat protein